MILYIHIHTHVCVYVYMYTGGNEDFLETHKTTDSHSQSRCCCFSAVGLCNLGHSSVF